MPFINCFQLWPIYRSSARTNPPLHPGKLQQPYVKALPKRMTVLNCDAEN